MEREQIIKAMECCENGTCKECPIRGVDFCWVKLSKYSLAIVRELTEENERLRAEVAREIFAEIERLAICRDYPFTVCLDEDEFKQLKNKYGVE